MAEHSSDTPSLSECKERLGLHPQRWESLPFLDGDATAGTETELQVAVAGDRRNADLPITIAESNYYENLLRRAAAGDTPRHSVHLLEDYLESNPEGVWENSWVRFPRHKLSPYANRVLEIDLRAQKTAPDSPPRRDTDRFLFHQDGEEFVRIPISYLLKLALADAVDDPDRSTRRIRETADRVMDHFLNDNTSPETHSFQVVSLSPRTGNGDAVARETSRRYLLTQLLVQYANDKLGLRELGQEGMVFFSPHPPVRQKALNRCISDSFYRDLFISPCLSGWDKGEEKQEYMALCHETMSRSHLNTVAKLREARIVVHNLIMLPTTSNMSLSNNGTHISIGSRRLTALRSDPGSGFTAAHEKLLGDLAVKVMEHFLSLFVGTYSAAPYRLDFADCHPETALGFLAHELDYSHLRMLWRRWKGKARNRVFGRGISPFGPHLLDKSLSLFFRLKGDLVPDLRLVDYPVALLSTQKSPALDGTLGNHERLRNDLHDLGIFHRRMSLYLPLKLRERDEVGFCGVEGRHYSLFASLGDDLARAAEIQLLLMAFAYHLIVRDELTHLDIPDSPIVESERRQIFFASSVGIPTFYVRSDTRNRLLRKLLARTRKVTPSRRYRGYLRVLVNEYRKAALTVLQEEGAPLIEALELEETVRDLRARLENPDLSAYGKLLQGALREADSRNAFAVGADEFNTASERYYRGSLRRQHMLEALEHFEADVQKLGFDGPRRETLRELVGDETPQEFVTRHRGELLSGKSDQNVLRRLIRLLILLEESSAPLFRVPLPETVS